MLTKDQVLGLKETDMPLIVFSDKIDGVFSWFIRRFSGAPTHAMFMVEPGKVITQEWRIKERPISHYLDGKYKLWFWRGIHWGAPEKAKARILAKRWLDRENGDYDVLGVIGHALRMRWLNNPFDFYCSEMVAALLNKMDGCVYRRHPSPARLMRSCKENRRMKLVGRYVPER